VLEFKIVTLLMRLCYSRATSRMCIVRCMQTAGGNHQARVMFFVVRILINAIIVRELSS